jgi:hypothetical protein
VRSFDQRIRIFRTVFNATTTNPKKLAIIPGPKSISLLRLQQHEQRFSRLTDPVFVNPVAGTYVRLAATDRRYPGHNGLSVTLQILRV